MARSILNDDGAQATPTVAIAVKAILLRATGRHDSSQAAASHARGSPLGQSSTSSWGL